MMPHAIHIESKGLDSMSCLPTDGVAAHSADTSVSFSAKSSDMNAAAISTQSTETAPQMARRALGLAALAESAMRAAPSRIALSECEFESNSRTPRQMSNLASMREIVRLSAFLQVLKLPPRSVIAVVMPNRPEATIAILAVLHAGHRPLVLSLALEDKDIWRSLEDAGAVVALTVTDAPGTDAAERMRHAAARLFGLRFVAAYGPDAPDGVISLDLLPNIKNETALAPSTDPELEVLTRDPAEGRIVARGCDGLVAASLPLLSAASMMGGQRLINLLPPDDLAGLALSIAGPLASGLSVMMLDEFDSTRLAATLAKGEQCHLVAPAFMAPALAASGLLDSPLLRTLILVDKAPWQLPEPLTQKLPLRLRIIDVVALDEMGLFIATRSNGACLGFSVVEPVPAVASGVRLLEARTEEGKLWLRGAMAPGMPFELTRAVGTASKAQEFTPLSGWRATRFASDTMDGRIIALRTIS